MVFRATNGQSIKAPTPLCLSFSPTHQRVLTRLSFPFPTLQQANMRYSIVLTAVLASLGLASDVLELKEDTLQGFVEEHDLSLIECEFTYSFRSHPTPLPPSNS